MKDLYFRYNPQPSKILLERGAIVEGSYFLADGEIHFKDETTVPCEFEVAHMQSEICWAVVYFQFPDKGETSPIFERYHFEKQFRLATKLTGTERLFQRYVEVELDLWVGQKGSSRFPGLRLVYIANEYNVTAVSETKTTPILTVFHITNLPIAESYSPETTRKLGTYEYLGEVCYESVQAALEYVIQNDEDATPEELLKLGHKVAEQKTDEMLANPFSHRKKIAIEIGDKKIAYLEWYKKFEDREYESQPSARLVINNKEIPQNWSADGVAEWTCVLLSVAVGRMIIWSYYYVAPHKMDALKPEERWVSRTLQNHHFTAFTEENSRLSIHGFDENSHAIKLITDVLAHILQDSVETTEEYLTALIDYVYYASTTGDDQHRCTLLCALVENVFSIWEFNTDTEIGKEIPRQHSRKIQKTAKKAIDGIFKDVLPQKESETEEKYKQRRKAFLDRIGNAIGNNLSNSFKYKLVALFTEQEWAEYAVESMVKDFVASRNKLFHEHRFASDSSKEILDDSERSRRIVREITNIEMFVPLLLATLLQYRGRYWDKLQNSWRWMPAPKTKSENYK